MTSAVRVAVCAVLAVVAFVPATTAHAQGAIVDRSHVAQETVVAPFVNPCTGQNDQVTLTQSGQNLLVIRPNGTLSTVANRRSRRRQ